MPLFAQTLPDLMPPAFAEGLDDWSRGDGTPDSPTYEGSGLARLARDAEFGVCLELRTSEPVQRLRYMGELPVPPGAFLEVTTRLKVLRGPLPEVRIAARPGCAHGVRVDGVPVAAAVQSIPAHGVTVGLRAVVGPSPVEGVDFVWDMRVLYAHVGLDLLGAPGAVVRIESLAVCEITDRVTPYGRLLPGFRLDRLRR
ncbi:MAG TPA: hypothetical protein VM891_02000 [Amaricoccus sp.]|jgi:hypothetical protein|nr:hypothetical protein [Amaricoccus sp.]